MNWPARSKEGCFRRGVRPSFRQTQVAADLGVIDSPKISAPRANQ
jgi:hypothetical protein